MSLRPIVSCALHELFAWLTPGWKAKTGEDSPGLMRREVRPVDPGNGADDLLWREATIPDHHKEAIDRFGLPISHLVLDVVVIQLETPLCHGHDPR